MNVLLSSNTINFWLASSNISPKIISLFAFMATPYIFKFLLAIFINHHKILWLSNKIGHYKSWLILTQFMLTLCLIGASFLEPKQDLWLIAFVGLLIALFAVIQDIILNYNRIKTLDAASQPIGTAMYSIGYRLGMLCSGAGVIFTSIYFNWKIIYFILAAIYVLFMIATLYCYDDPKNDEEKLNSTLNTNSWHKIFVEPFQSFLVSKNFIWIALFILCYRLSDNMLIIMLNPFLLETGYSTAEIASISKFFGIIVVMIGGFISGLIMTHFSVRTSLISFSLLHIGGHLLFIPLTILGKNIPLLYFITACEALTGGMMMTAYLSFISNLCKGKHTAIQYALLSSGMGLSRVFFPAMSGEIVITYGWLIFFSVIVLVSVVTTILTCLIPKRLF